MMETISPVAADIGTPALFSPIVAPAKAGAHEHGPPSPGTGTRRREARNPAIACGPGRPSRFAHAVAGLLAASAVSCAPKESLSGAPAEETDPAVLAAYGRCDESRAGRPLDLDGAVVTFADQFDRPSITPPDGVGPWFAPVHGGFGLAKFLPPHPTDGPFFSEDGVLTIRLARRDGRWTSGIIQSVNAAGEGFSQRYGYFEMRAKFPRGHGTWPGFWLKTVNQFTDPSQTRAEIDVIEAYGGNDWSGYHATVHLWPARDRGPGQLQKHWRQGCYERVDGDMFDGSWHLYGAEIGPEWVVIYYERWEIGRFPTLPEFRHPLFVLADIALLGPKDPRTTDEPSDMQIDYVAVWQRAEWETRRAACGFGVRTC